MIQEQRVRFLNNKGVRPGSYVLYWMQQSQRAEYNHALEYAIGRANELGLPVVVYFGLTGAYPEANARHYAFMLEGLRQVERDLERRGMLFVTRVVSPAEGAVEMGKGAALAVTDRGYLGIQKEWRAAAAERIGCGLVQVESDVVVPVEAASPKEEYSAGTFRPKITRLLYGYLVPLKKHRCGVSSLGMGIPADDISDTAAVLRKLRADDSVLQAAGLAGGTAAAKRLLAAFIARKLDSYGELRNDPGEDSLSRMSPYLHFGQMSPLQIALSLIDSASPGKESYLEELIVRRELAMNFVHYNHGYERYDCVPEWAKRTLAAHARDRREHVYSRGELERAATHDRYWNAAQTEMLRAGTMHGYMRMYWGKKIIEWTQDPEEAFAIALYLNNRYCIDGRDPNSYAGVAWCFGKHDRAWPERKYFGKVRCMNERGLERKFDMDAYCARVEVLPR